MAQVVQKCESWWFDSHSPQFVVSLRHLTHIAFSVCGSSVWLCECVWRSESP